MTKKMIEIYECIEGLIHDSVAKAHEAMVRYPQERGVIPPLTKFSEESGEVVKAATKCIEGKAHITDVRDEMIDAIAMIIRLYVEGDRTHGLPPVFETIMQIDDQVTPAKGPRL